MKRKKFKSAANNTSLKFNRSISTYGKSQMRLLNDVPCTNWLPSDDSQTLSKAKGIFSDTTSSFNCDTDKEPILPSKSAPRNNIFDSDSEDDDFRIPKKKKRRCVEKKMRETTVTKKKEKLKLSSSTKTRKPRKRTKNEKPKMDKPDIDPHLVVQNLQDDAENIPPVISPKVASIDSTPAVPPHNTDQSGDMFANFECENNPNNVNEAVSFAHEVTHKSILKTNVKKVSFHDKKSFNESGKVDISVCSAQRVSFNSTVVYHAANIEMSETVNDKLSIPGIHLQNNTPIVVQSTPLTNKKILPKLPSEMVLKTNGNVMQQQSSFLIANDNVIPSPTINEKNLPATTCETLLSDPKKPRFTAPKPKKLAARKPPAKKMSKKVPIWSKKGGHSFYKKKGNAKSDNDSILHQIMIGGKNFDPNYDFVEDSADAYFVNSTSDDVVGVKLCQKPESEKQPQGNAEGKKQTEKTQQSKELAAKSKTVKIVVRKSTRASKIPKSLQTDVDETEKEDTVANQVSQDKVTRKTRGTRKNSRRLAAKKSVQSTLKSDSTYDQEEIVSRPNAKVCAGRPKRSLRKKSQVNYKLLVRGAWEKSIQNLQIPENHFLSANEKKSINTTGITDIDIEAFPSEKPKQHQAQTIDNGTSWTRRKARQIPPPTLTDDSPLFSSLSFFSTLCKDDGQNFEKHSGDTRKYHQEKSTSQIAVPRRRLRSRKQVNYKDLSNGLIKSNKKDVLKEETANKSSCSVEVSNYSTESHNSSEGSAQLDNSGDSKNERSGDVPRVDQIFICDRNLRKRKTVPLVESKSSSLFSSLSLNSEKNSPVAAVPMHAFSTINRSNSDEENHGTLLSDDEDVNTHAAVAKRMSTPIVIRSPERAAQTLYTTPQNLPSAPSSAPVSHKILTPKEKVDNFSPIPSDSARSPTFYFEGIRSSISPPLGHLPFNRITHPRIASLKDQQRKASTPNYVKPEVKSFTPAHKEDVADSSSRIKPTSLRRRVKSPGSHLSSPTIRIDKSYKSLGMSENRRRTLDSVRIDLSSAIRGSDEQNDAEVTPNTSRTRGKSMQVSAAKVLVTPMRESFVEQLTSSGNRIKLRSLGFVDALTPKRARSIDGRILTAREKVLYECDQLEPKLFEEALSGVITESCVKLGEGLYGEVFRCNYAKRSDSVAMKIIPIEGSLVVNCETQKTFNEVLPEIISSKELHILRQGTENVTTGFIELHKVSCVKGQYPEFLLNAWDAYDEEKTSENDRPDQFAKDQLYLIFQYADGGVDVEHFKFRSAAQAFSVLQQVCSALAVAERSLQFEHRDLHWGNILVTPTTEETLPVVLHGKEVVVTTHGVKASIIDFTLSRLSKGGVTVYQNLAADPDLFAMDSESDYQFEIYRMMKKATGNKWSMFQPKNNIFWLHYLNDKFCNAIKYTHRKAYIHRSYITKLRQLDDDLLQYSSCADAVNSSGLLSLN